MRQVFINAIENNRCVEIRYHGYTRVVEPHACGDTRAGNYVVRAFQVRGGSVSNEPIGWKLFRLDEMNDAILLNESALSPRPGYRKGDKAIYSIDSEY